MAKVAQVVLDQIVQRVVETARLLGDIYLNLHGVGQAVDIILVTPEQIERYRNTRCLVIALPCEKAKNSTVPERYPPEDPKGWLNRARSNFLLAGVPRKLLHC